jgi:hypothetical protein
MMEKDPETHKLHFTLNNNNILYQGDHSEDEEEMDS